MKRFRQFITEMPLPLTQDEIHGKEGVNTLRPGKYSSKALIPKFAGKFTQISKGSSRIVFIAEVPQSDLKDEDLQTLFGYTPHLGKNVSTVIKLAINKEGITQNKAELQVWNLVKSNKQISKYFLPILDWSNSDKYGQYSKYYITNDIESKNTDGVLLTNNSGPFWLQMPVVTVAANAKEEFDSLFESKFNIPFAKIENYSTAHYNKLIAKSVAPKNIEKHKLKNGEGNDFLTLIEFITKNKISIGDLARYENWGIYHGIPVILDYGFDSDIGEYLYDKKKAKLLNYQAIVDKDGIVRISFNSLDHLK